MKRLYRHHTFPKGVALAVYFGRKGFSVKGYSIENLWNPVNPSDLFGKSSTVDILLHMDGASPVSGFKLYAPKLLKTATFKRHTRKTRTWIVQKVLRVGKEEAETIASIIENRPELVSSLLQLYGPTAKKQVANVLDWLGTHNTELTVIPAPSRLVKEFAALAKYETERKEVPV